MSDCRSCGQAIRWVQTEKGRPMPLDFMPTPDGNVTIETNESGRGPVVKVWGDPTAIPAGRQRFVSHFVTCPNAKEHRRG